MSLPRSVKEMSKLDFLPRHCESENFRGFSFIGENFPVPQRNKSEEDHYWNNVDDDGQSLSECASSVFDDDLNELPAEPEPAKKKRPPRKKKKKQPQTIPLETTNEETGADISSEKPKVVEVSPEAKITTNPTNSALEEQNTAIIEHTETVKPSNDKESLIVTQTSAKEKPPQARAESTSSSKVGNSTVKSLNPTAKSWQAVKPQTTKLSQAVQQVQTPTVVAAPVYTPKPGTWASLAVGKGKPNQSQPVSQQAAKTSMTTAPIVEQPTSPRRSSALSQDWRTHVVSPRQSKQSVNMNTNRAPPPPVAPQSGQNNSWPSLGDFPPPPGTKSAPKQQTKSLGAWGKAS